MSHYPPMVGVEYCRVCLSASLNLSTAGECKECCRILGYTYTPAMPPPYEKLIRSANEDGAE